LFVEKWVVYDEVSITSIFGKNKKEVEPKSDQAEINIFTVASGLLYEVRILTAFY